MKKNILRISFFFFIIASSANTFAQSIDFSQYNSWAAGIKFGLLPFYGDVRQLHYSAENKYKKTNTAFTFELIKNFNHVFGARLNVLSGGLSGSSENLNMHFTSSVLEPSVSGILNINDLVGIYPTKNKVINTYLFAGIGAVSFRSKVYSFDEDSYITGYGWDSIGYSKASRRNEFVFPVGIGFKFNADEKFDIGLELTLHLTNTDKLDAWIVGNSYNDRYSYAAISFTYKIGNRAEYVDWISPYQDTTLANILLARSKANEPVDVLNNNATNNVVTNTNNANNNQNVAENNSGIVELKYFIISGTYTSKKLAKEAAERLVTKGYPNANYFMQKSSGNWRVYYKGYATIDAALADWPQMKKTNTYAKLLEKKEKESYSDITSTYKNYTPVVKDTVKTQTTNNVVTNSNNTNINSNVSNNTSNTSNNTTNNSNTTNNTNSNNNSTSSNNTNTTTNNSTSNTNTAVIKKFFIIAGSFATEDLANDGVAELKAKGFIYAEVVGKNDYGSYRIAYKGYATRDEAAVDLVTIKQNTNPSAWIFEKK